MWKSSLFLLLLIVAAVTSQRTSLDVAFRNAYRPLRLLGLAFTGRSGDEAANVQRVRDAGVSLESDMLFPLPYLYPLILRKLKIRMRERVLCCSFAMQKMDLVDVVMSVRRAYIVCVLEISISLEEWVTL